MNQLHRDQNNEIDTINQHKSSERRGFNSSRNVE